MSKEELEAGDIVANKNITAESTPLGMVMRNDEDGLLVAYPGQDELLYELEGFLEYQGNIEQWLKWDEHSGDN